VWRRGLSIEYKLFYRILELTVDSTVFADRVLRIWSSLPEELASADHLSLFVRHWKQRRVNVMSKCLVGNV